MSHLDECLLRLGELELGQDYDWRRVPFDKLDSLEPKVCVLAFRGKLEQEKSKNPELAISSQLESGPSRKEIENRKGIQKLASKLMARLGYDAVRPGEWIKGGGSEELLRKLKRMVGRATRKGGTPPHRAVAECAQSLDMLLEQQVQRRRDKEREEAVALRERKWDLLDLVFPAKESTDPKRRFERLIKPTLEREKQQNKLVKGLEEKVGAVYIKADTRLVTPNLKPFIEALKHEGCLDLWDEWRHLTNRKKKGERVGK